MHDRLGAAERQLLDALARAHGRGWRLVDIEHGFRKMPGLRLDLLHCLDGGLDRWRRARGYDDAEAATIVERLTAFIDHLPDAIPVSDAAQPTVDDKLLARVRGLLAKAESTEYGPEAEALLAKAHELMARHSIDHADVARGDATHEVIRRRVLVDEPYVRARMVLLDEIARACGCRVLMRVGLGFATVFGVAADVETTEVLYTSLLLQASQAMMTSTAAPLGAPPSTLASFRRSFLFAFAERVGHRLRELRGAIVDEVQEKRGDLLPVLAERRAAVDADVERFTPSAVRFSRGSSGAGLVAGDRAGQRASLGTSTFASNKGALSA